MAIASMVLGILWVYWVGSILALVFGYIALRQIKERNEAGHGMALAGVVLGWVGVGIGAVVIVIVIVAAATSSGIMTTLSRPRPLRRHERATVGVLDPLNRLPGLILLGGQPVLSLAPMCS